MGDEPTWSGVITTGSNTHGSNHVAPVHPLGSGGGALRDERWAWINESRWGMGHHPLSISGTTGDSM